MNFSLKVKESTNIFTIKNILRERHGQMEDLKICFTAFTEGNEVKNDMLTLTGTYIRGAVGFNLEVSPGICSLMKGKIDCDCDMTACVD